MNRNTRASIRAASSAVLAWTLLGGVAHAQEAPATGTEAQAAATDATGLGDIVVTARRVAENLQDVPVAVTVQSGDDLLRQNARIVSDIANFTPSLNIRQASGTPSAIVITLRGQGQSDTIATLDPSVGTYVDGMYWARAYGLNSNLLDLSSVQVLKGPQGTLFGRNTTGGALLITTNDPDLTEYSGRALVSYGKLDEILAEGVVNIPVVEDKFGVRLAVQRYKRDGYTTNLVPATATTAVTANTPTLRRFTGNRNGVKLDNRDRWNARGKLAWKPTETLTITLAGEFFDMDERSPARQLLLGSPGFVGSNSTYNVGGTGALFVGLTTGNPPATAGAAGLAALNAQAAVLAGAPGQSINNEIPFTLARTYTGTGTVSLDTDFGNVKLIGGYRKVRQASAFDLDGSQYAIHYTEGSQRLDQFSVELQTSGKAFDDRLDFVVGGFFFNEGGFDQSISITIPALNPVSSNFFGKISTDSLGFFAQGTWAFTDQLSVTGGVRYSVDEKGLTSRSNNFNRSTGLTTCALVAGAAFNANGDLSPDRCSISRSDSFSGWSYTAGVQYKPTDDILIYARTDKGFRSGGQNLRAPSPTFFLPFSPEIAYSYEVGLKSEFFDRRVRVNLAAFQSDVSDLQRSTLIGVGAVTATILSNAGKARFRGIEAEVQAIIVDGLRLSATGSLIDPKYVRFSDLSGNRSQERFPNVTEEQFSLAADYTTPIGATARLDARVDYAWSGRTPLDPYFFAPNPLNDAIVRATTRKAYGLLGARVAVEFADRYQLAVFGRNLTNERHINSALIVAPLGYVSGTRQEPRTYGIQGIVKF